MAAKHAMPDDPIAALARAMIDSDDAAEARRARLEAERRAAKEAATRAGLAAARRNATEQRSRVHIDEATAQKMQARRFFLLLRFAQRCWLFQSLICSLPPSACDAE